MRLETKRPIRAETAAPELARLLARALGKSAELATSPALAVTVEDPVEDTELAARLQEERFTRELDWHLEELLGPPRAPRVLHFRAVCAETSALVIEPLSARAQSARLEWASGCFEIDGTKPLLAAGRGPVRRRFPGARNDIVLDDALVFVSRDAFALRWDPARAAWRLEVDEIGRAFVEIQRRGSVLIPQLGSIPLELGDVIALTGGPGSAERLEIRFGAERKESR